MMRRLRALSIVLVVVGLTSAAHRRLPRPMPLPRSTALQPSAEQSNATPAKHRRRRFVVAPGHGCRREAARVAGRPRELSLWGAGISDAGVKQLAAFPNLSTLVLENTEVTDAGLEVLDKLPKLKSLNLRRTTRMTDAGLAHVRRCRISNTCRCSTTISTARAWPN